MYPSTNDHDGCYPSLSRGINTFTIERLNTILSSEGFPCDSKTKLEAEGYSIVSDGPREIACVIDTSFFEVESEGDGIRCFTDHDTKLRAIEFCKKLHGDSTPESISVQNLDAMFSQVFRFQFEPLEDSHAIVERASNLLERMPARPPELDDIPPIVPQAYHASRIASTSPRESSLWDKLQSTEYVSSNVLRVALAAVMCPDCASSLQDMVSITATLLEIASQLVPTDSCRDFSWRSFVARAFLWTSWQRCQIIYHHLAASSSLDFGSSDGKGRGLTLRGTFPSPGVTVHEFSRQRSSLQKSAYMCGWNFELLRNNPVCIGADFRRFHQRYTAAFGSHPARCLEGQSESCGGNSPRSCRRFQGMAIEDQSAHDQSCLRDCRRLIWNEASYRSVTGARAVSLAMTNSDHCETVQYCGASNLTLAISHVWSHGQGGRPETGFNHCLHLRYSRLAKSLGCTSYWIDTTSIPDDHQLRDESIAKINEVFGNAKVVLVCDRDLMELDVSDMTVAACETVLVAAIVSDWNVRAWTFFEAFRARKTLHLLCKKDTVVPLKDVSEMVHRRGALEIGSLLLAMPHFLPALNDHELAKRSFPGRKTFQEGYLDVEFSGSLLSHRAASRPDDDFVIWSLLMSEKTIFYNAEAFWKSMQGSAFQGTGGIGDIVSDALSIRTGFIVSSASQISHNFLHIQCSPIFCRWPPRGSPRRPRSSRSPGWGGYNSRGDNTGGNNYPTRHNACLR